MDEAGSDVRRGRRWPETVAAVGGAVVAVVATLAVPAWLSAQGQDVPVLPRPPSPTEEPQVPGSTTWQAIRCPPVNVDVCVAPVEIDHGGAMFSSVGGRRQQIVAGSPSSRRLSVTLTRSQHDRWVLVGADHAGADSRLTVVLGTAAAVSVPPGRLSLFSVPGHRRVVVTVADLGRPRDGEVLRVQRYAVR